MAVHIQVLLWRWLSCCVLQGMLSFALIVVGAHASEDWAFFEGGGNMRRTNQKQNTEIFRVELRPFGLSLVRVFLLVVMTWLSLI